MIGEVGMVGSDDVAGSFGSVHEWASWGSWDFWTALVNLLLDPCCRREWNARQEESKAAVEEWNQEGKGKRRWSWCCVVGGAGLFRARAFLA
jgi:hypothetical protein